MDINTQIYTELTEAMNDIAVLFKGSRCLNIELARQKMADLKARCKQLHKQYKGTEIGDIIGKVVAFDITVRSNSIPNEEWLSNLYSAEVTLQDLRRK